MGNAVESVHPPVPRLVFQFNEPAVFTAQRDRLRQTRNVNPERASCGHGKTSRRTRRDPEELGKDVDGMMGGGGEGEEWPERAEETLQRPGKGETVTSGRGRTGWTHIVRRKRNKGIGGAEGGRGRDEFKESYEEKGARARERRQ